MKCIDECLGILSDNSYSVQIATVLIPNSYEKVEWCSLQVELKNTMFLI